MLRIFAARAGAEIERRRHEAALRAREREVAASRARMVSIADEERRQIGRNLHDGAQQRMIVLGHRIELARRKLEQDPEQAAEHLRHASEEARAAGAELRELARGLHPAGLAEYGLEPTLAALAGRSPLAARGRRAARPAAARGRRGHDLLPRQRGALQRRQVRGRHARAGRGRAGRRPRASPRSPTTARAAPTRRRAPASPGSASRIEALGGTLDGDSARRRGHARCARGSRSRRGARRASRSWSSATRTTAAPAPS